MSQVNTAAIRNREGEGFGIDIANGGNVSFNTNTLYVDASNDRIGFGTVSPTAPLHMLGGTGFSASTAPLLERITIVSSSINAAPNIRVDTGGNNHIFTVANTGNFVPNIGTGAGAASNLSSIINVGQFLAVNLLVAVGGSSGYITGNINIAGAPVTTIWAGSTPPVQLAGTSGYDIYNFHIYRYGAADYLVNAFTGHYE